MTLQPNFSNASSQEHSLSFSQHFSYPMHASAPCNTVGTIIPSYRHFLAFILSPLLPNTLFSAPPFYTPHSFCVYSPNKIFILPKLHKVSLDIIKTKTLVPILQSCSTTCVLGLSIHYKVSFTKHNKGQTHNNCMGVITVIRVLSSLSPNNNCI